MTRKQELAKNTFIIMIGKISTQFLTFFLLPIYTFTLSQSELGTFDLITAYVTLLVPVLTLQLESAVFRFLIDARDNKNKQYSVVSNSFLVLFLEIVISCIVFFIIKLFIVIPYDMYILGNIIGYALSGVGLQICRGLGDNKLYSLGSFLCGFLTFVLSFVFLVIFKVGIPGLFISTMFSNILLFIIIFVKLNLFKSISKINYDKKLIKSMLIYSIPLTISGISWWVISASDKTLITWLLGSSRNGIYTVSSKFALIYTSIYTIFNLSWTESASVYIKDKDRELYFNNVALISFNLFFCLFIGMIAAISVFFPLLINSSYNEAYIYIPILLFGTFLNAICSFLASIFLAVKDSQLVAKTSFTSAVLNFFINLILIKYIGLYAAALSTVLALVVIFIKRYRKAQEIISIKLPLKTLVNSFIIMLLVVGMYYIENVFVHVFLLIFTVLISIIINKEIILNFRDILKSGGKSLWKKKKLV